MDDMPEWVIPVIVFVVVAIVVALIIEFLVGHPFISGLLIGLFVGIGGTVIIYRIIQWLKTHSIEVKETKED